MNKENIKELAELRVQEKSIDKRIKELVPIVLSDVISAGKDKVETPLGNFNIKSRKIWKYSPEVDRIKKVLDDLKVEEEANGAATFTEVDQLEFREIKIKQ